MYFKIRYFHLHFFTFLLVSIFGFQSCQPQQFLFKKLPEKRLEFGNGGGFAGTADTYTLLQNGQLFHTNSLTQETLELESFEKNEAKDFFKRIEREELSNLQFNHPGNTYYFITYRTSNNEHKLVWGSTESTTPPICRKLYKDLIATVKNHNP